MSLKERLLAHVSREGPMNVATFMSECLMHPTYGYYMTRDPFGTGGDFVTAPEVSQMFGELLGLCLAQTWLDQGAPSRFTLAELGPGRGTLMADLLRATRGVPGFHDAAQVHLLEASPFLRKRQAEALSGAQPVWLDKLDGLPQEPLYLVANEFFDALPIRQFVREGDTWRERQVGADQDQLTFGFGPAQPQPALDARFAHVQDGDLIEEAPSAAPIIEIIGRRINAYGGAALLIDYGDWQSLGDTLQALQAHRAVSPLDAPGEVDLTAHVDFEALTLAAPCPFTRLTTQGVFLERLGITQRAQALAQNGSPKAIEQAHRRLTHPDEMGTLFKVLGLYPESSSPPPGLEP